MTTKKNKYKAKKDSVIISPGKSEKRHSAAITLTNELIAINERLRNYQNWLAQTSTRYSQEELNEMSDALHKRRSVLRKELSRIRPAKRSAKSRRIREQGFINSKTIASKGSADKQIILENYVLKRLLDLPKFSSFLFEDQQPKGCPFSMMWGKEAATDFRQYNWEELPGGAGLSGEIAFWPLQYNILPNVTPTVGWPGETGAHFFGWLNVASSLGIDPLESIAAAAVLQFTLPPAPCDVMVNWSAAGVVEAPRPWLADADYGRMVTEWVLRQDPSGGTFPVSIIDDYQWFIEGLYSRGFWIPQWYREMFERMGLEDLLEGMDNTISSNTKVFTGSFPVRQGIASTIYIGISLELQAIDGTVQTFRSLDQGEFEDYFEILDGIFWTMEPLTQ
jgi:hypothetical protein